jgi:hypothetical protein
LAASHSRVGSEVIFLTLFGGDVVEHKDTRTVQHRTGSVKMPKHLLVHVVQIFSDVCKCFSNIISVAEFLRESAIVNRSSTMLDLPRNSI